MTISNTMRMLQLPYIVAILLCAFTTLFFWPGILTPDSISQFEQAISGLLTDHHPPLMALYWRLLHALVPGSGLMFLTQQLLLWGAIGLFIHTFSTSQWKYFFVLIPFWPQVFRYEFFILKDVQFAFSFLFVAAALSYFQVNNKRPSWLSVAGLLLVLFYGTAVKYQAQFVLPVVTVWLSLVMRSYPSTSSGRTDSFIANQEPAHPSPEPRRRIEGVTARIFSQVLLHGACIAAVMLFTLHTFNHLVTDQKNHSWQFVKLYDLAAMSLERGQSLFPEFITNKSQFSMQAVAQRFNTQRVDDLLNDGGPLSVGNNDIERNAVYRAWVHAVFMHPWSYLQHRLRLLNRLVTTQLGRSFAAIGSDQSIPAGVRTPIIFMEKIGIERLFRLLLSFKTYLVLMIFYVLLSIYYAGASVFAQPLFFLNVMGLVLIAAMGIFSMATDPRYIYLVTCCHQLSHPFFFSMMRELHLWQRIRHDGKQRLDKIRLSLRV